MYLYFTAETPGFSSFVITGKMVEEEILAEILPQSDPQILEQNNGYIGSMLKRSLSEQETQKQRIYGQKIKRQETQASLRKKIRTCQVLKLFPALSVCLAYSCIEENR
jgi:hypothetical protein